MTAAGHHSMLYQVKLWQDMESWDRFVSEHGHHSYFCWSFKRVVEQSFGHRTYYLAATDGNNQMVAVLPLVELKSMLFGHYGVSLPFVNYGGVVCAEDHPEAVKILIDAAQKLASDLKLQHMTLRHDTPLPGCTWPSQQHKVTMILDLPEDDDALMKSFKSKLRAQVRRPSKEGATAKTGKLELLDDFYRVFSRNMRDLGTPVYSKQWFKNLLNEPGLSTQLVLVYLDEQPVAAGFLIQHGATMEIPWASSLREFNRYSVNMLLYWEALSYSIRQGCKQFDFGRSSKDAPTFKFKKQWGAEPRQLYWYQWTPDAQGAVKLDPKNSKFALATRLWQKLPLPIANLLGPFLVKNLP